MGKRYYCGHLWEKTLSTIEREEAQKEKRVSRWTVALSGREGTAKEGILRCRESGWHENHPGGDMWRQVGIGAQEADGGLLGSIGREATGGEELAEGERKKHGSQGREGKDQRQRYREGEGKPGGQGVFQPTGASQNPLCWYISFLGLQ